MKHFVKIVGSIAIALLILGAGFTLAGFIMGATLNDTQFVLQLGEKLRHENQVLNGAEEEDEEILGTLTTETSVDSHGRVYEMEAPANLSIELNADELYLESYHGDVIRIEVDDEEEDYIQVSTGDDFLKITGTRKIHDGSVIVYLPDGLLLDSLKIQVDAGSVEIENEIHTSELDIKIGAGSLEASERIYAETAFIEVGAGDVEMEEMSCSYLSGNCGIGSMELTLCGKEKDYNYYLECGLGEITIGENMHSSIADHEEITYENVEKRLELSCGMGEIEVDFTED
jgi:hypothetical protein